MMAIFYFDIRVGSNPTSLDDHGEEFADLGAARIRAGQALCSLARNLLRKGHTPDLCIEVRDNFGTVLWIELNYRARLH